MHLLCMHSKIICTFVLARVSRLVNWLVIEAERRSKDFLSVFWKVDNDF